MGEDDLERKPSKEISELYQSEKDSDEVVDESEWSSLRRFLHAVLANKRFDTFMGVVITLNLVFMVMETDARAACWPNQDTCGDSEGLTWANRMLLFIYTLESMTRVYVERSQFCKDKWNVIDLIIVVFGYVDELVNLMAAGNFPSMQVLPMLRLMRVARMVRAAGFLRVFPELYIMIKGFVGAMRAMMWGLFLIILLLLFWAMICVEVIHPMNMDMITKMRAEGEEFDKFCVDAFASVWSAAMVLFQTLVAGDSFGQCIMPIIGYSKASFLIFSFALMSMALGLLNLILAVIVDHATEAREGDREERVKAKRQEEQNSIEEWKQVIREIDEDGNGSISYDELLHAYSTHHVRNTLNMMGLTKKDLEEMFMLLDADGSGTLNYKEFIDSFLKAQNQDMRIYLMMSRLRGEAMERKVQSIIQKLEGIDGERPCGQSLAPEACACKAQAEVHRTSASSAASQAASEVASFFRADLEEVNLSVQKGLAQLAQRLELNIAAVLDQEQALPKKTCDGGIADSPGKVAAYSPANGRHAALSPVLLPLSPPGVAPALNGEKPISAADVALVCPNVAVEVSADKSAGYRARAINLPIPKPKAVQH